jgi:hypothetical protein
VSAANNYIAENQSRGALRKDPANAAELNGVLADLAESVRIAATLLLPIMPSSATEVLRRVGDERALKDRQLTDTEWRSSGEKHILNAGALWPRIEAEKGVNVEDQKPVGATGAGGASGAQVPSAAPGASTTNSAPATQAGPAPSAPDAPASDHD